MGDRDKDVAVRRTVVLGVKVAASPGGDTYASASSTRNDDPAKMRHKGSKPMMRAT
jgi:hypothetical protein